MRTIARYQIPVSYSSVICRHPIINPTKKSANRRSGPDDPGLDGGEQAWRGVATLGVEVVQIAIVALLSVAVAALPRFTTAGPGNPVPSAKLPIRPMRGL
ncbi:hypothetical protein [Actinoplanes subtropicus]|uniref:hypothetical protein n=1 Tax=Actinoplanes subtropicus TaxID=543632 RepID=UPI0004C40350|nr:hypothetical protein [Actinoplanes subtropicus]